MKRTSLWEIRERVVRVRRMVVVSIKVMDDVGAEVEWKIAIRVKGRKVVRRRGRPWER